jgi:hypothetical protein
MKITRNMKSVVVGIALLSAVGVSLTGCTQPTDDGQISTSVQELGYMESPNPTMDFDGNERDQMAGNYWTPLADGNIEIALHGSSSCPPAVEKITKTASSTVTVKLKTLDKNTACTMDYRGFYVAVIAAGDVETVEIYSNSDGKPTSLPKN